MKRGCPRHPKTIRLALKLRIKNREAVGLLETLFHITAEFAYRGDIGRIGADMLAHYLEWDDDPQILLDALEQSGWLDRDDDGVLIIHDWAEHAEDSVRRRVKRDEEAGKPGFCVPAGVAPPMSEIVRTCPDMSGQCTDMSRLPRPRPEPWPEPEPVSPPTPSPRPDAEPRGAGRAPHAGEIPPPDEHGIPPDRLCQVPAFRAAIAAVQDAYPGPKTARARQARLIGQVASELALGHDPPMTIAAALGELARRVEAFAASPETRRRDRQFVPAMARWLEDGHWQVTADEWAVEGKNQDSAVDFDRIFGATA